MPDKVQNFAEWAASLSPELKAIAFHLYDFCLRQSTDLHERISYGAPFIYGKGPICYFAKEQQRPYISFYWGKHLEDESGLLHVDEKKMVKRVFLENLMPIEKHEEAIYALFLKALDIDRAKYAKG